MSSTKFQGTKQMVLVSLCLLAWYGAYCTFAVRMPTIMANLDMGSWEMGIARFVGGISGFILAFYAPKLFKLLPPSKWLFINVFGVILFCVMNYLATNQYIIYASFLTYGLCSAVGGSAGGSIFVSAWYIAKRDKWFGIVLAMPTLGTALNSLLYSGLTLLLGDGITFPLLVVMWSVIGIVTGAMLRMPADVGQTAYVDESVVQEGEALETVEVEGVDGATARKSASFWLLVLGMCFAGFFGIFTAYWTVVAASGGLSTSGGSLGYSFFMFASAIGVVVIANVAGRWGWKAYLALMFSTLLVGMFIAEMWLITASGLVIFLVASIIVGFGNGGTCAITGTLMTKIFGAKCLDSVSPLIWNVMSIASSVAMVTLSLLPDIQGSWIGTGWICLGCGIAECVCFVLAGVLRPMRALEKKNEA